MGNSKTRTKEKISSPIVLRSILEEIRLLRSELMLLLPQEDVAGYAHPKQIKRSYEKALKRYPPAAIWR